MNATGRVPPIGWNCTINLTSRKLEPAAPSLEDTVGAWNEKMAEEIGSASLALADGSQAPHGAM
jgi:hypothetical protein